MEKRELTPMKTPVKNCTLMSQSVKCQGAHPCEIPGVKAHLQRPKLRSSVHAMNPSVYGTLAEAHEGDAPKTVQSTCKNPGFLRSWDSDVQGEQQEQTKSMIQCRSKVMKCAANPMAVGT